MKSIWKFPLMIADRQEIAMPRGAELLSAHVQDDRLCVWATVDPDAPYDRVAFRIFGTGHAVPESGLAFVGTVLMAHGRLVFHVFREQGAGARQ